MVVVVGKKGREKKKNGRSGIRKTEEVRLKRDWRPRAGQKNW